MFGLGEGTQPWTSSTRAAINVRKRTESARAASRAGERDGLLNAVQDDDGWATSRIRVVETRERV